MWTLDTALDDYLHLIVRTRPWTKKREEEVLTPFVEWLYQQPAARVDLAAVTPTAIASYAAAVDLSPDEQQELSIALHHLVMWAERNRAVEANSFADAVAA